jgi:ubiquinone/menaquinone biosynthesis C-methylase UbiE
MRAISDHPDESTDLWSEWLLHIRHADDPGYAAVVRGLVEGYADRVLDGAGLAPGMILADVGAGEGLLAFRAIDRMGPSLRVILTDISAAMLRHAEAIAIDRGVRAQCEFHVNPADHLTGLADASVDVVATRASLAYVADKPAALREFHRVLKPGGRISLCEPILQDEAFFARVLRRKIEGRGSGPADRFMVLLHRWKAAQFPDTEELCAKSPITNFSERDLLNFVRAAGFGDVHLELHIDVMPSPITSWEVHLGISPHPWAPTLRQILAEQFSTEERQLFEQIVRPIVESGKNMSTERAAYIVAKKAAPLQ